MMIKKALFSSCLSPPLALTLFLPSLPQGSLSLSGGFEGAIPSRAKCFKVSHSLDKCQAVGLYVCSDLLGGSFSDAGLRRC